MERINIKPLSVNDAWKGRRYRTDKYKKFNCDVQLLLPPIKEYFQGKLKLSVCFGFSSRGSDIDNPLKPFLDALQIRYGINDNQIYELNVIKKIVKKGNDYIEYKIEKIKEL